MNRWIVIAIGAALILIGALYIAGVREPAWQQRQATPMRFEVATTTEAQERGLGGRAEVPDNYGMLFVFPEAGNYGFWMKDMLVSIDIIWLADDGTITGIVDSISPATYAQPNPLIVYPPAPVKYVLETRAGYARDHGWRKGTKVPLPPGPY